MITKFDTTSSGAPSTSSSGGGTKTIITILVLAAAAYVGYRFVYKPYMEKKAQAENE